MSLTEKIRSHINKKPASSFSYIIGAGLVLISLQQASMNLNNYISKKNDLYEFELSYGRNVAISFAIAELAQLRKERLSDFMLQYGTRKALESYLKEKSI
jgi:hypothetical protein